MMRIILRFGMVLLLLTWGLFTIIGQSEEEPIVEPEQQYAPYVYMGGYPSYFLANIAETLGIRYFTLGFILDSAGKCQAKWLGSAALNNFSLATDIAKLQDAGGDVIVSFGGAGGTELAMACLTVESLIEQYQLVIDTLSVSALDFDIEGDEMHDSESIDRRSEAIAMLQEIYDEQEIDLSVSFTLPVLTTGLTEDGMNLLRSAIEHDVDIDVVNIMTMNFEESAPPDQMGQNTIDAAESLFGQLQELYPDDEEDEIWSMIGVTPMIGVNDRSVQEFTLEDAELVLNFAIEKGIGRVSMWAFDRDEECVSGVRVATINCSGILQEPYAYSEIFNQLNISEDE